jgi:hypothetical protein
MAGLPMAPQSVILAREVNIPTHPLTGTRGTICVPAKIHQKHRCNPGEQVQLSLMQDDRVQCGAPRSSLMKRQVEVPLFPDDRLQ